MAANIDILYEDNHLLVIHKPAGLPSQSDQTEDVCALDLAKEYIRTTYGKPGNVFAGLVHRLDRPVSGNLMIAKTSKSLSRMMEQFRNREVKKEYLAITDRRMTEAEMHLEHYLIKNRSKNVSQVVHPKHKKAKQALLDAKHVMTFGKYTLIQVEPMTGRSHQIRVQLSAIGLPICGDVKYGGMKHHERTAICLHSHTLEFLHPTTKKWIRVTSLPYQQHWQPYGQLLARVKTP